MGRVIFAWTCSAYYDIDRFGDVRRGWGDMDGVAHMDGGSGGGYGWGWLMWMGVRDIA